MAYVQTNGVAVTGSQPANTNSGTMKVAANNQGVPCSQTQVVSGLAIGTTYWLDISLAALTGGTASVTSITLSATELRQ